MVGDADTHGLLLALEDAGDVVVGVQDESERAGQVSFHHLIDLVADGAGKLAQHAEIMELLGESSIQEGTAPSYEVPLLSVPTVVLIHSRVGSAIDTVAQAANDMGITTVGTHTAGATGDLFTVDLGGGIYTGFSSFYIFNNADGVPLHNNGIKASVQSDNDAASVAEGIDRPLLDAWEIVRDLVK